MAFVAGVKIGASICYEDAYASDQLPVLRDATLLVNVTNDAWFGESTAAYQHLQISRMRALEAGRVLLRAANDGISAVIDGKLIYIQADGAVMAVSLDRGARKRLARAMDGEAQRGT